MRMLEFLSQLFRARQRQDGTEELPMAAETTPATCVRCKRRITVDPALSRDVFEGMHWLCFHLEFEHDTDPDIPCSDYSGCPWWKIKYLEERLRTLGVDPEGVVLEGIKREADDLR